MLSELAPAKVNLFLHVLGRRPDGYHRLESLVTFADFGDRLRWLPDEPPGLAISGPFAPGLEADETNLVLKARRLFSAHFGRLRPGGFHLEKHLPVASGIGGGSADAAAALRLLARAHDLSLADPRLLDCAAGLGADVPMCLAGTARLVSGIGHELGPPLATTTMPALLANPRRPVATPEIFARLALAPGQRFTPPATAQAAATADPLARLAALTRNDLQPPAEAMVPDIAMLVAALAASPGCGLARMSGSGATVFAVFRAVHEREAALAMLANRFPESWRQAVMLPIPTGET